MPSAKLPIPNGRRELTTFDSPWNPNGRLSELFVPGVESLVSADGGSIPSSSYHDSAASSSPGTSVGSPSSASNV
jgi:hypothetical protein